MAYEPDFFTAAGDATTDALPKDSIGHIELAGKLLAQMEKLGAPSVMSVEGSWGSGKSDLMRRMYRSITDSKREELHALWINPWQYGTTDLLTPLVAQITQKLARDKQKKQIVRDAVRTLLLAGINFGLKALPVPYATITKSIITEDELGKLIDSVLARLEGDSHKEAQGKPPSERPGDPVAQMAEAFRDLVNELAPDDQPVEKSMVFVFVDDIDRCLPDRQVAMLEALRFLLSAGANARFVIAIDPHLATVALGSHFKVPYLDTVRFLDKLFHLRFHVPTLAPDCVKDMISTNGEIQLRISEAGEVARADTKKYFATGDPIEALAHKVFEDGDWPKAATTVFSLEGLNNPRTIVRAIRRLGMFAAFSSRPIIKRDLTTIFFGWLAISVRWPEARRAFQYVASLRDSRWEDFQMAIGLAEASPSSNALRVIRHLRFRRLAKDGAFGAFMADIFREDRFPQLKEIEKLFAAAGL